MDCRTTLNNNETFLKLLQSLSRSGDKVSLLLDDKGITRAEGFIKVIHTDIPDPFIELTSGMKIITRTIVAVNGVFLPEYGEC